MSVECFDSEGAAVYDLIIKQVIQDLQITRSINDMKTFIDPTGPVCIIAIKPNKAQKQILFNDIGNYMQKEGEDKVQLFILDENYLPNVLNRLWDLEGREKIQQPGRYEIVINNPTVDLDNLVIHDPTENLRRKLYDAIFRIIPEGFNVVQDISEDDVIAIVSTDELLTKEWIEKGHKMVEELKS